MSDPRVPTDVLSAIFDGRWIGNCTVGPSDDMVVNGQSVGGRCVTWRVKWFSAGIRPRGRLECSHDGLRIEADITAETAGDVAARMLRALTAAGGPPAADQGGKSAPPHDPERAARIEALRQRGVLPPDEPPPDAHANFRAIFERNRAKVYAENPTPRSTRIGDIKGSVVLDVPDDGSLT